MSQGDAAERFPTPPQIHTQLQAQAAGILAEGVVLTSFVHRGVRGIEREEPIRRFLRTHLPSRFHVGQGSIASAEAMLNRQNDIIVADRDLCFMLLNTVSSQLLAIESVHLIVEVRSRAGELPDVAAGLREVRNLRANEGLRQYGAQGSQRGFTDQPVHTVVIYQGPKQEETLVENLGQANAADTEQGRRLAVDFVFALAKQDDQNPASGYLVGYSRKDLQTGHEYSPHYYPQVRGPGLDGPKVLVRGGESFARWYASILNHLAGVTVYPPIIFAYLGDQVTYVPWTTWPR
jgi:hypothetical protein